MACSIRILRIHGYNKRFPKWNQLNEQELEDKIWKFTNEPISKNKLCAKVKGRKENCLKKINEMVQTSQLREKDETNRKLYVRLDYMKRDEFDFGFEFQKNLLGDTREVIKKAKYPMFKKIRKGEYMPRGELIGSVGHAFQVMNFYYSSLLLFISRTNLQRSIGIITKPEADRRNKKCENALNDHFKKLQSENKRESKAIKQYLKNKIYSIENFKI